MRTLSAAGLFLFSVCVSAQNLNLTLADQLPQSGVVSTRTMDGLSLNAASGERVSFAKRSGRDYRLQASGGFFWTQVQELPRDASAVAITPTLQDDGSVRVALEVFQKAADRERSYSSTLIAQPGEWLQLMGTPASQQRGVKVYGTQQVAGDNLYLLVEPFMP